MYETQDYYIRDCVIQAEPNQQQTPTFLCFYVPFSYFLDLQNNTIPLKKKFLKSLCLLSLCSDIYIHVSIFFDISKTKKINFKKDLFDIMLRMFGDFFFQVLSLIRTTKRRFLFFYFEEKTIEAIFSGYSRENITLRRCTTSCRYTRNGTSRNESSFL